MAISLHGVELATMAQLSQMDQFARLAALDGRPYTVEDQAAWDRDISGCHFSIYDVRTGQMVLGNWQFQRWGTPSRGCQICIVIQGLRYLYRVNRTIMEANGIHGAIWASFERCMD